MRTTDPPPLLSGGGPLCAPAGFCLGAGSPRATAFSLGAGFARRVGARRRSCTVAVSSTWKNANLIVHRLRLLLERARGPAFSSTIAEFGWVASSICSEPC